MRTKPILAFLVTTIALYAIGTAIDSKFFGLRLDFDSAGNFFTEISFLPIIVGALAALIVHKKSSP